jgi:hypothetical protein
MICIFRNYEGTAINAYFLTNFTIGQPLTASGVMVDWRVQNKTLARVLESGASIIDSRIPHSLQSSPKWLASAEIYW